MPLPSNFSRTHRRIWTAGPGTSWRPATGGAVRTRVVVVTMDNWALLFSGDAVVLGLSGGGRGSNQGAWFLRLFHHYGDVIPRQFLFLTHLRGKVANISWRAAVEHVRAAHSLKKNERQVYRGFSHPPFQSPHATYIWISTAVVSFRTLTASLFARTVCSIGTADTGHKPQQKRSSHQGQNYLQHLQGKRGKMFKAVRLTFQVFLEVRICHLLCENQARCQASHTSSVVSSKPLCCSLYTRPEPPTPQKESTSDVPASTRKRPTFSHLTDPVPCERLPIMIVLNCYHKEMEGQH